MSHYSDIGFEIENSKDIIKLFNNIISNQNIDRLEYFINDDITLTIFNIRDIRYIAKINNKTHQILSLSLGHDNLNVSEVEFVEIINNETFKFSNIMVEKEGIPFWFSCANTEVCELKQNDNIEIKIASFAESIKIKDCDENSLNTEKFAMADESYISNFEGNQSCAFVSGIIKDYKLEKNFLTYNSYYTIDFDCLGLHFKALVDEKAINKEDLQVGKIICGNFWNTALIEK